MQHFTIHLLVIGLFPFLNQSKVFSKDLGMISNSQILAGKELKKLIDQNPGASTYRITLKEKMGRTLDHTTIIYLSGEKKLGRITKTDLPGGPMVFWRVWFNVEPHHFKEGLPYGAKSISDTTNPGSFPLAKYLE